MGTSIRMEAIKGETMSQEDWEVLHVYWTSHIDQYAEQDNDYITGEIIYCSYGRAEINRQVEEFSEWLKGKDVTINLWYEEREPDETVNFKEEATE